MAKVGLVCEALSFTEDVEKDRIEVVSFSDLVDVKVFIQTYLLASSGEKLVVNSCTCKVAFIGRVDVVENA